MKKLKNMFNKLILVSKYKKEIELLKKEIEKLKKEPQKLIDKMN